MIFIRKYLISASVFISFFAHSEVVYKDISSLSGFIMSHDTSGALEVGNFGMGQAFIDVNNDNFQDIVVSNQNLPSKIFINNGDQSFTESTFQLNIPLNDSKCKGVSVADYNNDGWDDIYFSCLGADHLFKNNSGTSFEDVSVEAGINNPYNSHASAWADINNDGWLDLYVINYTGNTYEDGVVIIGDQSIADAFYLNNGDGTFTDIISEFDLSQTGKANLAVTFFDYDNDNDQDLYVIADKEQKNVLWENIGPATSECGTFWCFKDVSIVSNANTAVFGMGIATGDIDNDGDFDLYFSDISKQSLLLSQVAQGSKSFVDVSVGSALNIPAVGWGTQFIDFNNDGWLDAYLATHNDVSELADSLFLNNADGTFTNVTENCGATNLLKSEGVASGDISNDGRMDLVLGNLGENYQLFENHIAGAGNWLRLKLNGDSPINKNAIGAKVSLYTDNGLVQIREVTSGSSRGAGNELPLHFGFGSADITLMKINWPDRSVTHHYGISKNQMIEINYSDFNNIFANGFD